MDWHCQNRKAQRACTIWPWLVLHQSWLVLTTSPSTSICLFSLSWVDCFSLNWWQLPWQGRFTSEEVLASAVFREFMVAARGMEAVHPTSARVVVLLHVTYSSNCTEWTSLILTQRGRLPWLSSSSYSLQYHFSNICSNRCQFFWGVFFYGVHRCQCASKFSVRESIIT